MRGRKSENIKFRNVIEVSCYGFIIGCYNFNIFYVILLATIEEKPIANTQKNTIE